MSMSKDETMSPGQELARLWLMAKDRDLEELMARTQALLEGGASPDAESREGRTALEYCAMRGWIEPMELLRKAGAKLDREGRTGALELAQSARMMEAVRWLIENGAEWGRLNRVGEDALMRAAEAGDEDLVELLIQKGARASRTGLSGTTTLQLAAKGGSVRILEGVWENGGAWRSQEEAREAIKVAAWRGNSEAMLWLARKGAPMRWEEEGEGARLGIAEALKYCDMSEGQWEEMTSLHGAIEGKDVIELGEALGELWTESKTKKWERCVRWLESSAEEGMLMVALSVCAGVARRSGMAVSELEGVERRIEALMESASLRAESEPRKARAKSSAL